MIEQNAEVQPVEECLPKYSAKIKSQGASWNLRRLDEALKEAEDKQLLKLQLSCKMLNDTTTVQGTGVGISGAISSCFENLAHLIQKVEQLDR